jgi:hypothetical protein
LGKHQNDQCDKKKNFRGKDFEGHEDKEKTSQSRHESLLIVETYLDIWMIEINTSWGGDERMTDRLTKGRRGLRVGFWVGLGALGLAVGFFVFPPMVGILVGEAVSLAKVMKFLSSS